MTPATNTTLDLTHHEPRFYDRLCLSLMVLCICTGLFATIGWILGAYELVTPAVSALSLLFSAAVALGWWFIVFFSIWPLVSKIRWFGLLLETVLGVVGVFLIWNIFAWKLIDSYHLTVSMVGTYCILLTVAAGLGCLCTIWIVTHRQTPATICIAMLFGTAICCGGPLGAWYVFFWTPLSIYHDFDRWNSRTAEATHSSCHRILVWCPGPHDQFLDLAYCGDKSSVPFIIGALRWMPPEERRMCTWGHALDALSTITNHSAGSTKEEWDQWYAANKDLTQREWWVTGFVAEGYPEVAAGGSESIRGLFRAMGRVPWSHRNDKPWLVRNAKLLLASMDKKEIKRTVAEVMQNGSVQEQCGLAQYVEKQDRAYSEPILRKLIQNNEKPVRLWASGVLCRLLLKWYENPAGFIVKRLKPNSVSAEDFFSPSGATVVVPNEGTYADIDEPTAGTRRSTISAIPSARPPALIGMGGGGMPMPASMGVLPLAIKAPSAGPMCVIQIDWPPKTLEYTEKGVAAITLEGLCPVTKKPVYSEELIVTNADDVSELRWFYNSKDDSVYVSVPDYTCKIDRTSGRMIWEISFGSDHNDSIVLLEGYLIIREWGYLVFCDTSTGEILAKYSLPESRWLDDQITLVNGKLRAKDSDDALYILRLPDLSDE